MKVSIVQGIRSAMIIDAVKRPIRPLVYHMRIVRAIPRPVAAYPSYEVALAACGPGYADSELADVVMQMTRQLLSTNIRRHLYEPNVRAALKALRLSSATRVLDFGGSCGLHYFVAKQQTGRPFKWAVVETPVMTKVSAILQSNELRFFTNIEEALCWLGDVPDLVFSSGALQYTPDPETCLTNLTEIGAPYLAILREALALGPSRVTIQMSRLSDNDPGGLPAGVENKEVKHPRTHISRDTFLKIVATRYRIIRRGWLQHEFPLEAVGVKLCMGYSFICARR
jgi:putative methyltransferase (TIGR04325 family)